MTSLPVVRPEEPGDTESRRPQRTASIASQNSLFGKRRRHKFRSRNRVAHLDAAHSKHFDIKIVFVIICYVQLFFTMVSLVMLMSGSKFRWRPFLVESTMLGACGMALASAAFEFRLGLVLYEVALIAYFGFELNFFLVKLANQTTQDCVVINDVADVFVKEKLYSFAFIVVACISAHRLRRSLAPVSDQHEIFSDSGSDSDHKQSPDHQDK
eukprot:c518_g1_i1.p1 GENE.c518_g1_i1~~c518_g1_i1.p1  ORF type:complete len:227 (-),score=31.89 c518_g1_i1:69-704(-)